MLRTAGAKIWLHTQPHCQPTFSSLTVLSTSNTSDLAPNPPPAERPIGTTAIIMITFGARRPRPGPMEKLPACKLCGKGFGDCLQLQLQKNSRTSRMANLISISRRRLSVVPCIARWTYISNSHTWFCCIVNRCLGILSHEFGSVNLSQTQSYPRPSKVAHDDFRA